MRPPSGRVRAPHPLTCKRASIMQLAMDDFSSGKQRWAALMARARHSSGHVRLPDAACRLPGLLPGQAAADPAGRPAGNA